MKKSYLLVLLIIVLSISLILPLVSCKDKKEPETPEDPVIPYEYVDGSTIYIVMGEYPQSLVKDIAISDIKSGAYDETTGYYTYNDNKYKIVTAHSCNTVSNKVFTNGDEVVDGQEYAFLVEPIVWKILNKNLGDDYHFVYSNVILDTAIFQKQENIGRSSTGIKNYYLYDEDGDLAISQEIYANNWQYSELRNTLTKFYNLAFTKDNKTAIRLSTISNSSDDSDLDYFPSHQQDTQEYVFCLSKKEATNSRYGFTEEDKEKRLRPVTDYAIANGAFFVNRSGKLYGYAWTRTAASASNTVYKVSTQGEMTESIISDDNDFRVGYAPGMKINKL